MKLSVPFHCKSDDRTKLATSNPICGDPMVWFNNALFRNEGINVTSFDFFVNWDNETLQPIAWVKRTLYDCSGSTAMEIMNAIIKCDGFDGFQAARNFCNANNIELSYILIPDIPCEQWKDEKNKVILFNVARYEVGDENAVLYLSVKDLIDLIHTYRVKYDEARMDTRGLIYSTSSLEYFLSKHQPDIEYRGDAIYPGDADIVLFDNEYTPLAVVEIKKHNEGSKKYAKTIQSESISNYIKQDRLKYKSLNILQQALKCKFYMLFYPTTNENVVKMEQIEALSAVDEMLFPLPNIHSPISIQSFQQLFLQWFRSMKSKMNNNTSYIVDQKTYFCPHCRSKIKSGRYGYYCSSKCGMDINRRFGKTIPDELVGQLLSGQEVEFQGKILLPEWKEYSFVNEGTEETVIRYQWKTS